MMDRCRHMLINATLAMPAKIANEAVKFKKCCGMQCYAVATLEQTILGRMKPDSFTIEIDGEAVTNHLKQDVETILLMLMNGKTTGAGMVVIPFACMNDGLIDITWIHDPKV